VTRARVTAWTADRPMRRLEAALVEEYLQRDRVAGLLQRESAPGDEELTVQRWLAETPAKRLTVDLLYGDLLEGPPRSVLDVGGGLSALTRLLAARHEYELLDLMAHDQESKIAKFRESLPGLRLHRADWWSAEISGPYDVVVANDLFPNVDQRLALFLDRLLPLAREIRLSLTYYNRPRFYLAKRLDADEILGVLAWDGRQTRAALEPYAARIERACLDELARTDDTVFANGRQVCVLTLRGDA
jgi:hypothetical protein